MRAIRPEVVDKKVTPPLDRVISGYQLGIILLVPGAVDNKNSCYLCPDYKIENLSISNCACLRNKRKVLLIAG
ncbi:hypothetical protein [Moorella stamsii]|uniref:hypothetical protein n=1 Tax=Neomoorella stamsii TaxID=1266720 RepID=UPI0006D5B582|nr:MULTISPECIES: hypothetical protein [Moorella]